MSDEKVTISQEAMDEFLMVRDTGQVNMFDRKGVIEIAEMLELDAFLNWARDNGSHFGELVFGGIEVV